MSVVVFILAYNSFPLLQSGALKSIVRAAININDAKIVFLDNYSRDGSIKYVKENYPNIDVLLAPYNYLYCKAINAGLQYIYHRYSPEYYLLVDADNLCEQDAYYELVQFIKSNMKIGIVQPIVKKYSDHNILYSCGHYFDESYSCRPIKNIPEESNKLLDLPSCSISSTLIKAEVFQKCGLLDPIYDIYYESADLSFRARKQGFRCACNIKAVTYNEGAKVDDIDSYHERYYRTRNKLIFWKKHDENIYKEVKKKLIETYKELNSKLMNSLYGLDIQEESIRKGIEDGLKITKCINKNSNLIKIESYDKTKITLI